MDCSHNFVRRGHVEGRIARHTHHGCYKIGWGGGNALANAVQCVIMLRMNYLIKAVQLLITLAMVLAGGVAFLGSLVFGVMCGLRVVSLLAEGYLVEDVLPGVAGAVSCLVCAGFVFCMVWCHAVPKRPKAEALQTPACGENLLPYSTLEQRFADMAAIEPDEVELDKAARHLAWWDRGCRSVVILGLGGEDWLAFAWGGYEEVLFRRQLQELCRREGVELPAAGHEYQPSAVAFCRGGRLTVYPASRLEDFVQDIPPLREEAAFRPWMDECTRMGCLDC